ncbi:MAG: hypothetical protein M1832_000829 [Thelocarpon impressellum]|nr:MAG: hypothetical protein M1832_000829 [Thelocarpon impressellum]
MPQGPGEDLLLTVFADVHYYFGPPQSKPPHHRFDKGSYVYLYRNTSQSRGRLEIANNAGTPDQDAFSGFLDSTHTQYSHKQPSKVTLTVDGSTLGPPGTIPSLPSDLRQWYLPALDPRNEAKYMFRLHTIDFYFWTTDDALLFLRSVGLLLPPAQIRVLDAPVPPSAHVDAMSPVVQKLEHAAISDGAYARRESGSVSATSTSFHNPVLGGLPAAPPAGGPPDTTKVGELPGDFAPLAYNPAAPAAPEPIKHREKTPPPPEAADGTGLAAAAYGPDVGQHAPPPVQQQKHFATLPGEQQQQQPYQVMQPQRQHSIPRQDSYVSQPSPLPSRTPSLQTASLLPNRTNSIPHSVTGSGVPSPRQQAVQSFAPPPQDPNAHLYGKASPSPQTITQQPHLTASPPTAQAVHPAFRQSPVQTPPAGGYSTYQYGQQQAQQPGAPPPLPQGPPLPLQQAPADPYNLHQQVYRPTEVEAKTHGNSRPGVAGPGQAPGKFEAHSAKVEKGVGKFLKKLEKKMG